MKILITPEQEDFIQRVNARIFAFSVRGLLEDFHANKSLEPIFTQEDMRDINIILKNVIYSYIKYNWDRNNQNPNTDDLKMVLLKHLKPFRDRVKHKKIFDESISEGIKQAIQMKQLFLKNPEYIKQRFGDIFLQDKYEPADYIQL
jgi:hypothetical protein